ncbi:hypothetical protein [Paraburkholderia oxyphila]|uniref:hypothetical protein n=1 Tax=Paraburkholderia oxyphila TaxID=614212 RepID=UPI0012EE9894|nr:hypothetical protein [Paraburkholderia oxyphila]
MKSRTVPILFVLGANLSAVALVAATAALCAPAFASGYGPSAAYGRTPGMHDPGRAMRSLGLRMKQRVASAHGDAPSDAGDARSIARSNQRLDLIGMSTSAPV